MPLVLLSIPGLRERDLASMPRLRELTRNGEQAVLTPSFPCVTCPVQANMTTGKLPSQHGVIANGFYWRDKQQVEMWTAWNDCIQAPQIWDFLSQHGDELTTAVWFPLHSKGANADLICTPAPVHNPDGSESLWCYTRPTELYGQLRDGLGHFPLKHFWGPLANIQSTAWIVGSAIIAARQSHPQFFYIYLPHLDYAAQKFG
ncbi:MAG TPA: alkaline phosphatase family protein, partial [Pirellulales bacterium]|nr:alkaline phosphatase family protein [Pirellulales bacterium]